MASKSIFGSVDSQRRWIQEMRNNFDADHISYTESDQRYCVYRVPESLSETRPEAYAPQIIGLGPYHHLRLRLEMYKMHKQKLAFVKQALPPEKLHCIDQVVSRLQESDRQVRACYDHYLDLEPNVLAWTLAVDGFFLLQYLRSALEKRDDDPMLKNLVGDMFMLENQIPSILLRMVGVYYRACLVGDNSNEANTGYVDFLINGGLLALCLKHSPLELSNEWAILRNTNQMHLLHRMYILIVNNRRGTDKMLLCDNDNDKLVLDDVMHNFKLKNEPTLNVPILVDVYPPCSYQEISRNARNMDSVLGRVFPNASTQRAPSYLTVMDGQKSLAHLSNHMYRLVKDPGGSTVQLIGGADSFSSYGDNRDRNKGELQVSENVKKIPRVLNELGVPGAGIVDRFLSIISLVPWDEVSALWGPKPAPPPFEKIKIPSVSEISKILGIKFVKTPGGIQYAEFDRRRRKLHLPVITLNTHSETILRNLLAYEAASSKPGSKLVLTEYVDLMCSMIHAETDVKILIEGGIIRGELQDDEIFGIFNGIRKTTGDGEWKGESNISKAISDINKMYSNIWRVKAKRKLQKFSSLGLKYMNVIVPIAVVLLLLAQAFYAIFVWFVERMSAEDKYPT